MWAAEKGDTAIATLLINTKRSIDIYNLFGHEVGNIIATYVPTETIECLNYNMEINSANKFTIFGNKSNVKERDNDSHLPSSPCPHN